MCFAYWLNGIEFNNLHFLSEVLNNNYYIFKWVVKKNMYFRYGAFHENWGFLFKIPDQTGKLPFVNVLTNYIANHMIFLPQTNYAASANFADITYMLKITNEGK